MKQRVVVTGLGVVAPNGVGKEAFWQALTDGLSGVRTIRRFDTSSYLSRIGGELVDFDFKRFFDAREVKKTDRSSLYAIAAGLMALEDSRLDLAQENRERIGSSIGNAIGGVDYAEREIDVLNERGPHWTSPYLATAFFPCATNGLLSIRLGLKGIVLTFCNGNTSGADAIGMGYRTVQSGRADIIFAGGTEAPLVPLFLGSLAKDGFLSKRNADPEKAPRPFDLDADGMVLGEGAALMVMETLDHARARGATIYGEIIGYASGNSAFDVLKARLQRTRARLHNASGALGSRDPPRRRGCRSCAGPFPAGVRCHGAPLLFRNIRTRGEEAACGRHFFLDGEQPRRPGRGSGRGQPAHARPSDDPFRREHPILAGRLPRQYRAQDPDGRARGDRPADVVLFPGQKQHSNF